jgi:hypothetical protein
LKIDWQFWLLQRVLSKWSGSRKISRQLSRAFGDNSLKLQREFTESWMNVLGSLVDASDIFNENPPRIFQTLLKFHSTICDFQKPQTFRHWTIFTISMNSLSLSTNCQTLRGYIMKPIGILKWTWTLEETWIFLQRKTQETTQFSIPLETLCHHFFFWNKQECPWLLSISFSIYQTFLEFKTFPCKYKEETSAVSPTRDFQFNFPFH